MPKKIEIKGVIVSNDEKLIYDWFGIEAVCPKDVNNEIQDAKGDDLEIEINSGGGDVFAGSEIYTILMDYNGNVAVKIVGIAASAAGVVAMAGKPVMMSPTAQIMIHNVISMQFGDYRAMEHEAEVLKNYNTSIANAYKLKTGMEEKELLKLMNKETWFTAQKALELKFIDEIMFDDQSKLVASCGNTLPPKVISKVRNHLIKIGEVGNGEIAVKTAKARLNFLKLKGVNENE